MEFYNPAEIGVEDLVKRTRVGVRTREFINTPTGTAIVERSLNECRNGNERMEGFT